MIETNDIKKNTKLLLDGNIYAVVDCEHVKPGKGSAFSRVRMRNLKTGQILDRTFKNGEKFEQPYLEHKKMQYLYSEETMLTFMDIETFEQVTVNKEFVGKNFVFLKENINVELLFYQEKPVNIEIPNFVELIIEYTEPGFKGNTSQGANKPATLEGGHTVTVPLHMKNGDILKVDTRTGEYVEKVNK